MIGQLRPVCLSMGAPVAPELVQCRESLRGVSDVLDCFDLGVAVEHLRNPAQAIDWVVFWQAFPRRWPFAVIERLHRASPLARLVVVAGMSAVGELVGKSAPAGVQRIWWHDFEERLRAAIAAHRCGRCHEWSLPRTATTADLALWLARRSPWFTTDMPRHDVAVIADRHVDFDAVAFPLKQAGLRAARVSIEEARDNGAARYHAVLWNLGDSRQVDVPPVICHPRALVLIDFPRLDEVAQWSAQGWRAVARPFRWSDVEPLLFGVTAQR